MITQPIAEELLRKQYGFRLPDYRRSSLFTHLTRIKYRRRSAHSFAGQLGCCGVVLAALQELGLKGIPGQLPRVRGHLRAEAAQP